MAAEQIFMCPGQSTNVGDDKQDRVLDRANKVLQEQGEVTETSGIENIQGVPQMQNSATKVSRMSVEIEPLAFMSQVNCMQPIGRNSRNGQGPQA